LKPTPSGVTLFHAHHLGFAEGVDRIARARETSLVESQDSLDVRSFDELRMSLSAH
jgi:hypothetical protein